MTNSSIPAVRQAIEDLIVAGTTFDISALDRIYHDSLQVFMIDPAGGISQSSKDDFKAMFQHKLEAGDPPLNTAANILHVEADESTAHVIIERSVALGETEQDITLSIDLVNAGQRWQVTREVIFAKG